LHKLSTAVLVSRSPSRIGGTSTSSVRSPVPRRG